MKTKHKKPFLQMDERNRQLAYRIMAVMYLITIIAIQGSVLYRQFVLQQELGEFEDLAIIMTVNSLFLITALLYFGAIPVRKIKLKTLLIGYLLIIILGSIFTYARYNLFGSPGLTIKQLFDKLIIVYAVSGIIVLFFTLFSFLGKRRIDKELDE